MSDYEHLIRGADGYRPPSKEPAESDFLRSSVEMDRYEGDGDEFMTARSKSFDEPAPEMGNYRTEALQTGAAGAFDIDAFRRQMGFVPLLDRLPCPRRRLRELPPPSSTTRRAMTIHRSIATRPRSTP